MAPSRVIMHHFSATMLFPFAYVPYASHLYIAIRLSPGGTTPGRATGNTEEAL